MDVTRDINGDEVLLWDNSGDPQPICNNAVVKIRLSDGNQSCVISFDWSLALNISAPDGDGYVFVDTYAPSNPAPDGKWFRYTDELLQVKLDGSEVRRLGHHRSRPANSYNWTPRVSSSRDGSRAVFSSNYDLQAISGYSSEYSDAYLLVLNPGGAPAAEAVADQPPSINAVLEADDAGPGKPLAPGSIVSVYGTQLASGSASMQGASLLPSQLAEASVQLDGVDAPILFASPSQLNIQIPWGLAGRTSATLTVTRRGMTGSTPVQLSTYSPSLLSLNQTGSGQGAILIANTSVLAAPSGVSAYADSRPVRSGDSISVFATGLGPVSNTPPDGAAAPGNPLSSATAAPSVTIGGVSSVVSFAGLAPGSVGIYRIDVEVPSGISSGDAVPLALTIAGSSSNTVTLAIQ